MKRQGQRAQGKSVCDNTRVGSARVTAEGHGRHSSGDKG
ncbi:hypothetical protein PCLA_12r0279 [Pseudomonas citronellolis]|nr:hypothetical protein PCLA_12r0279 [Pseudomonas citronellolis]